MKRLIALVMSLALILVCFAGCGSKTDDSSANNGDDNTAAQTTEAPANNDAETPEAEPTEEPAVTIEYPLTDDDLELTCWTTFVTNAGSYTEKYEDWPAIAWAEEDTGVHVEWIECNPGQAGELFKVSIAGGDYPDMYRGFIRYYGSGAQAYDDGVILKLNDLIDEYAPDYSAVLEDESCYRNSVDDDGNMWVMYSFIEDYRATGGLTLRKDMLDELNLDVPTTIDELTDALTAAKTEYGLTNALFIHSGNYLGSLCNLAHAFGTPGISEMSQSEPFYQVDGEVKFGTIEDGFKDYLEQMNAWYNAGIISKDFISASGNDKGDEAQATIANDAFAMNTVLELWSNYKDLATDDNYELIGVANITSDGTNVTHFTSKSRLGSSNMAVTTACENPEVAVKWLNWWFTEEGSNTANYGKEGETFTIEDGKPVFTDFVTNNVMDGLNVTQTANYYCLYNNVVGLFDEWRLSQFYSDSEVEAMNVWNDCTDDLYRMPTVTLTSAESEQIGTMLGDIQTYSMECTAKFITGEMGFDEWDTFVSTLKGLGADDCIAVYQDALDRYYQR